MTIPNGIYQHYKSPLYLVLGLAHDANVEGREVVVYIGLELDGAHLGPRLAVRTLEDFTSWIDPSDPENDCPAPESGQEQRKLWREGWRPRFRRLGEELDETMLKDTPEDKIRRLHSDRNGYCSTCGGVFPCVTVRIFDRTLR